MYKRKVFAGKDKLDITNEARRHIREDKMRAAHMQTALLLCLTLVSALILGSVTKPMTAQDEGSVVWKEPELIHATDGDIQQPSEILADAFGRVHIFWSEKPPEANNNRQNYYINYLRREEGRWTWPVDILSSADNQQALTATGVVDAADVLQLIWRSPKGIEYSNAAASTAESGNSWISPERIFDERVAEIDSFLDANEQLHIGFVIWADGIYHLQYDLLSGRLSNPVLIGIPAATDSSPNEPVVSVGEDGTIHMVWTEVLTESNTPVAVYYSRSEDGGMNWSPAKKLHEGGFLAEDVAQNGDEIHLLLLGIANVGGRGHIWSADGGLTWSGYNEIARSDQASGKSHGGIVIDDNGHVFAAFGMFIDAAVGYASWDGRSWSEPEVLPGLDGNSFEDIRLAIGGGNRLHAMFVDSHQKLWYSEGITQAAARPTPVAVLPLDGTVEENAGESASSPDATATHSAIPSFDNPPPQASNLFSPILLAGLLAAGFLVVVVFLVFRRR